MALDLLIRLMATGGDRVKGEMRGVASSAADIDKNLTKIGGNAGLDKATADAKQLDTSLSGATNATANLTGKLESVRNSAAGLAVAGAAGLVLAENFIQAGLEADRLNAKMGALLSGAGMSGAREQIEGIAAELAAITGGDDDTIAAQISQAITTGRTRGLTEFGIEITKSGQAAIAAAYKISDLAGRQETLRQVLAAATPAIQRQREAIGESAYTIGKFNTDWGNMEEKIGQGAARSKAAILGSILGPLISVVEKDEGLQNVAGSVLYIGSSAASIIGSIVSLASQVAITALAFGAQATATGTATTAMTTFGIAGKAAMAGIAAAAAPLLAALGLIITTAIAAQKAVEWTREAQTKSDEEMEGSNASMRQKAVAGLGRWLGTSRGGMFMEGQGFNKIAEGEAAEAESRRIVENMRNNSRARGRGHAYQDVSGRRKVRVEFAPIEIDAGVDEWERSLRRHGR